MYRALSQCLCLLKQDAFALAFFCKRFLLVNYVTVNHCSSFFLLLSYRSYIFLAFCLSFPFGFDAMSLDGKHITFEWFFIVFSF